MPIINLDNDPTNQISGLDNYQRAVYIAFGLRKTHALKDCIAATMILRAYINRGRWVVECPFCDSADLVSLSDLRFWCSECGMRPVGGCGLRVALPAPTARETIEKILLMRPNPVNRNWRHGETISQLARENLDHACISILEK